MKYGNYAPGFRERFRYDLVAEALKAQPRIAQEFYLAVCRAWERAEDVPELADPAPKIDVRGLAIQILGLSCAERARFSFGDLDRLIKTEESRPIDPGAGAWRQSAWRNS